MKSRKAIRAIALGAALAGVLLLASCGTSEMTRVRRLEIGSPSLQGLKDGSYEGRYAYGSFEYAVEVKVASARIVAIRVLANRNTKHAKEAEGVIPRILAAQSPDVDVVAGATTTSKALMKAVEEALLGARP